MTMLGKGIHQERLRALRALVVKTLSREMGKFVIHTATIRTHKVTVIP
jgi:hypothetical protein